MLQCERIAAQHDPSTLTVARSEVFTRPCYAVRVISQDASVRLLTFDRSARRDLAYYAMGLVGVAFVYAGATVNPAENCSEGGECAPWLVPVAFVMGVVAVFAAIGMLWANPRRGSRVDLATRTLIWWNDELSKGEHRIPLDLIGTVRVRYGIDERHIFLFDRQGQPISFPRDEVTPYTRREDWARALAAQALHIRVEVVGA